MVGGISNPTNAYLPLACFICFPDKGLSFNRSPLVYLNAGKGFNAGARIPWDLSQGSGAKQNELRPKLQGPGVGVGVTTPVPASGTTPVL